MTEENTQEKLENVPQPAAVTNAPRGQPGQPTGWRKWLYRLLAMTAVPALCLMLLETLLYLFGYGYHTGYLLCRDFSGQQAYTENLNFGRRFFPPGRTHLPMSMVYLPEGKPEGTYRIFILGESAALGYPDPAFHFGRFLKAMLHDRYPKAQFEVYNTAVAAISSHVILPIARDCAAHEPDLFIVYMGNNEVLGPYGPSGLHGTFSPSLALCRASIQVKATRTGQLLANWMFRATGADPSSSGTGDAAMFNDNQVPADDPQLPTVYSHFASNLQDICAVGRRAGARVVVCTVASDLKDSAPFASVSSANLTSEQAQTWKKIVADGIARESVQDHAGAAAHYRRALEIDDKEANLHYRLGRCLSALKQHKQAHEHYLLARDLDALRSRADTHINEAIRTTAKDREHDGVYLVDVVKAFENASTDGTPGEKLFYDPVHLTFEGNHLLARTIVKQISDSDILPDSIRPGRVPAPAILSVQACQELLPFTDWNRKKALDAIAPFAVRPPFTNQLDHAERKLLLLQRLEALKKRLDAGGMEEALVAYHKASARRSGDFFVHKDFATLLLEQGKLAEAVRQLDEALRLMPHDYVVHSQLAEIFRVQGKLPEALASCTESVRLNPDDPAVHNLMGRVLLSAGKPDKAADAFKQALRIRPDGADFHTNLGLALAMQKQDEQAVAEFKEALRLDPHFAPAHHQLGQLLNNQRQFDAANHHLQEALRINPRQAQVHADLAAVLANQLNFNAAALHLEESLRIQPNQPKVAQALQQIRLRMKRIP